jgi:hypothetical protein
MLLLLAMPRHRLGIIIFDAIAIASAPLSVPRHRLGIIIFDAITSAPLSAPRHAINSASPRHHHLRRHHLGTNGISRASSGWLLRPLSLTHSLSLSLAALVGCCVLSHHLSLSPLALSGLLLRPLSLTH